MSSIEDKMSSKLYEHFSGAPGDQDLRRNGSLKLPCRGVQVGTAGILVLMRPDGVEVAIETFAEDTFLPVQAVEILTAGSVGGAAEGATTTAQDITVYW